MIHTSLEVSGKYEKKVLGRNPKGSLTNTMSEVRCWEAPEVHGAPRAPVAGDRRHSPGAVHTESQSQAVRLSPCTNTDTGPGCPRHPVCPFPCSGLCFVLLDGTAAGRGMQAWRPASSEPTAGVKAGTGRAQGPGPRPLQRSPSQRHHCTVGRDLGLQASSSLL